MVASSQLMSLPLCQILSVFSIAMRTPLNIGSYLDIIADAPKLLSQPCRGFPGHGAALKSDLNPADKQRSCRLVPAVARLAEGNRQGLWTTSLKIFSSRAERTWTGW